MEIRKRIFPILLIIWGGLFCLLHFGSKAMDLMFMAGAEQKTGYVMDVQRRTTHFNNSSRNRTVSTSHMITVAYQVNGVDYTTTFNSGEFGISEGKPVTVYYKQANPRKAVTDLHLKTELHYMYPLMLGLGILFLFTDKKQ